MFRFLLAIAVLGRFPQAFEEGAKRFKESPLGKKRGYNPDFLKPAKPTDFLDGGQNFPKFMMGMVALELIGSTLSQLIQYTYLTIREYTGRGPNTSSSKHHEQLTAVPQQPVQPSAAQPENTVAASAATVRADQKKPVRPSERAQKRGNYAQERITERLAQEEMALGHGGRA